MAKTDAFDAAGETDKQWILPWITYTVSAISEREQAEMEACLASYPAGAELQFQQLSQWEAEEGIF